MQFHGARWAGIERSQLTRLKSFVQRALVGSVHFIAMMIAYNAWPSKHKFKTSHSSFAINFWNEAMSTNNSTWTYSQTVTKVVDRKDVSVRVGDQASEAARLICTVPLNLLIEVKFDPPLSAGKMTALEPPLDTSRNGPKFLLNHSLAINRDSAPTNRLPVPV